MLNYGKTLVESTRRLCILVGTLLALAAVAADRCQAITAVLKPNADVGIAFNDVPQGVFDVFVSLQRPEGWWIITNEESSIALDVSGSTIWNRIQVSDHLHRWEGIGSAGDCWSGVRFHGLLKGEAGPGTPPTFDVSVADIDIDVDSLGLHSDGEAGCWPPSGSYAEDVTEATEGGGLYLSPSLVNGTFPSQLPTDAPYKALTVTLRPKWIGPPNPDTVGDLTFNIAASGVALYRVSDRSQVTGTIRVPCSGFSGEQFGILTNGDFTVPGGIYAAFTWDENLKGGEDTTTDYVRLAPMAVGNFIRLWDANRTACRTTRAILPGLRVAKTYEDSERADCEQGDNSPLLVLGAAGTNMQQASLRLKCQFDSPELGAKIRWKVEDRSGAVIHSGSFATSDTVSLNLTAPSTSNNAHTGADYTVRIGMDWNQNGVLDTTEIYPIPFGIRVIGLAEYAYCNSCLSRQARVTMALSYPLTAENLSRFMNDTTWSYTSTGSQDASVAFSGDYQQRKGLGCDPTSLTQGTCKVYTWSSSSATAVKAMKDSGVINKLLRESISLAGIQQYYTDHPGETTHTFTGAGEFAFTFTGQDLAGAFRAPTVAGTVAVQTALATPKPVITGITISGNLQNLYNFPTSGANDRNGWASRIQACYAPQYSRPQGKIFKQVVAVDHSTNWSASPIACDDLDAIVTAWMQSF